MKIIIVGCGKVGYAIAQQLTQERHDITVVDDEAAHLNRADSTLDVLCIHGNGASISVLMEAGARDADLVIAVTGVLCVDYVFTEPYWEISFTLAGFPLTFIVMMFISVVTGMLTSRAKQVESLKREAERERIHSNLLRAVSHDIRTPLTGIVGATDVLLDQENALTPEQRHQLLSSANEDARWLIRIVENLLSITRIGAQGDAKVTKTLAVAEEVIEGAVAKFTSRGGKLPVHVHLPQEVLLVPMDELLIEQVLLNLLENAAIHAEGATEVDVTLERKGDVARITVEDNGVGIAHDKLNNLFDSSAHQSQQGSACQQRRKNAFQFHSGYSFRS